VIKSILARRNHDAAVKGAGFGLSLRGYLHSVWRDAIASLGCVLHDPGALAAIVVFILPWLSLIFLRDDWAWLQSFGQIVFVGFSFWWMSRSGSAEAAGIKYPMLESILAILLVLLWLVWRIGICAGSFPFLPSNFNCYENADYGVAPKLLENLLLPAAILFVLGYRWRAMGISWSWRAWWICLPALIMAAGVGLYFHQKDPLTFAQAVGRFFFGAGLPEEFLFRALLLSRLEAWWKSPSWALLGASAIFGLSHLPIDYFVFTRNNWRETLIMAFTFQMGFGFVFGFAFQRTRNVWPLSVFHAMVNAM
jgi:membrane protease YdiL (CAAX protease family)